MLYGHSWLIYTKYLSSVGALGASGLNLAHGLHSS